MQIKINNSKKGWEEAFNIINNIDFNLKKQVEIITEVSEDMINETGDISNLRYFLIIKDYLSDNHISYKLKITCLGEGGYQNIKRICQFFSMCFNSICIDNNNSLYFLSSNFIDEEDNLNLNNRNLMIKNEILSNMLKEARILYCQKNGYAFDSNKATDIFNKIYFTINTKEPNHINIIINKYISEKDFDNIQYAINMCIEQDFKEHNYKLSYYRHIRLYTDASDIFPIIRIDKMSFEPVKTLATIYSEPLFKPNNYSGVKNNGLKEIEKSNLIKEMEKSINIITAGESILVKCVFLFLLRDYIRSKEIFIMNKGNYSIDKTVFTKLFSDSKSYAEGMLQIIENSYLYSYGKYAYFFMRIYNADRNSAMGDFQKNSENRIGLFNKYKHCLPKNETNRIKPNHIFNDINYSDFFEFCIFDNAINKEGIIADYNKKNNGSAVKEIKEIIEETEEDYKKRHNSKSAEYFITHYGLRWFGKIVEKNNGCILLTSPNNSRISVYSSPNQMLESELADCCSYCTEHNILIPLSYKWQDQNNLKEKNGLNKYIFGDTISKEKYEFYMLKLPYNFTYNSQNEKKILLLITLKQ